MRALSQNGKTQPTCILQVGNCMMPLTKGWAFSFGSPAPQLSEWWSAVLNTRRKGLCPISNLPLSFALKYCK
jgi:hypothetical protein